MLSEIDQSVFITYDLAVIYPVPNKWGLKGATYFELRSLQKGMVKDALAHAFMKTAAGRHK
ncbi:MAG: hypothetical protein WBP41_02155 [Saprospiraceae bacterium]